MLVAGRVPRMGLAATRQTAAPNSATVNIVVNGREQALYGVAKPAGQYSGTTLFETSL